jgi:hypothetical protein
MIDYTIERRTDQDGFKYDIYNFKSDYPGLVYRWFKGSNTVNLIQDDCEINCFTFDFHLNSTTFRRVKSLIQQEEKALKEYEGD